MPFGPIMQLRAGKLHIELAPVRKDDLSAFISPGMQQASITRYLGSAGVAPVIEDELEWYENTRTDKTRLSWGIWVIKGRSRELIGTSGLFDIELQPIYQAHSGVLIANKAYWGKGIASHIHMARTWYVFKHMGLVRINSSVAHGNQASLRALEKCGYQLVFVERNTVFGDGGLRHQDNLECLNPAEWAWQLWWGSDTPTRQAVEARKHTLSAMGWAEKHVTLL